MWREQSSGRGEDSSDIILHYLTQSPRSDSQSKNEHASDCVNQSAVHLSDSLSYETTGDTVYVHIDNNYNVVG